MSTGRSPRARAPSNRAIQTAASSQPPKKRLRSGGQSSPGGPSLGGPSASEKEIPLSADIIDTIVRRVTDAVTQRLASSPNTDDSQSLAASTSSQPPTCSTTPGLVAPANLHEIPIGPMPGTTLQTQAAGPSSSSQIAAAVVNTSLAITQASLAGIPTTPEHMFTSPSLANDSRVSEKIQGKIWKNEYIDFCILLNNPVSEDCYQVTVKSAEGTPAAPAICLEPIAKSKRVIDN